MKKKALLLIWVCGVCCVCGGLAFGAPTLLQYQWPLSDHQTYAISSSSSRTIEEIGAINYGSMTGTCAYTVTQDNGNGSYILSDTSSNVVETQSDDGTETLASGSSTETIMSGSGRQLTAPSMTQLFPNLGQEGWDNGTVSDGTGELPSVAVDVNDTWTQTYYVTPYGQSQQTVTATCTLLEWTTLNNYNVAKIRKTYTLPICCYNAAEDVTGSGTANVTEYLWFAYTQGLMVRRTVTTSGLYTTQDAQDFVATVYLTTDSQTTKN